MKEEVKLSVLAEDISHIQKVPRLQEKLLELINKITKVGEYKMNMQRSVVFLYTNKEVFEKEIKESYLQQHEKQ